MSSRSVDLGLDHYGDDEYRIAHARRSRSKIGKKGGLILENPGFVLVLYNFLLALPLAYTLTILAQHFINVLGYTNVTSLVSRSVFIALNMWFIIGWGLQLEKEARIRKMNRVKSIAEEIEWWKGEVDRLEGLLGLVRQREVEDQLLRESPPSGYQGTDRSTVLYGSGHSPRKASVVTSLGSAKDMSRENDEDDDFEYEDEDDEDDGGVEIGEDEINDSESEGNGSG
ncbi:hypothetical protein WAI453_008117 [Rhynchosporium graminicola]